MSNSDHIAQKEEGVMEQIRPSKTQSNRWLPPQGNYLRADIQYYFRMKKFIRAMERLQTAKVSIVDFCEKHAREQPHHPCILYEQERYTYAEVAGNVNRTARWVMRSNPSLKKGDAVSVLLHNGPTILWTWLGLQKLGVIASMINYNLKGDALLHCLRVSRCKDVIFGSEFLKNVMDLLPELREMGVGLWMVNDARIPGLIPPDDVVSMDITTVSGAHLSSAEVDGLGDINSYIFTSGTTGMPKPAIIPHSKTLGAAEFYHGHSGLCSDDVYYVSLPIYHSAALLIAISGSFYKGATIAIAKKFSASRFWDDVRRYEATFFQYIGEICRYLLVQPKRDNDGQYPRPLRVAVGNGLRPDIWEEFQSRFKVGRIIEFYGATEGNFTFVNVYGYTGCVGRYSWILKMTYDNVEIVTYDADDSQPTRAPNGRCIPVPPGTPGLMLTKITDTMAFRGYLGPDEMTSKKIVRDVKQSGDMYYNTGDLMRIDPDGFVYFIDRLGDTFRWKGENVSTTEVSHALNSLPAVQEANVYGVRVPGHEGRVGMAAIVFHHGAEADLAAVYEHVTDSLPEYARPKFIRILAEMDTTATFKHLKTALVKRGFQDDGYGEVYVMDPSRRTYVPITEEYIRRVVAGVSKL